MVAGDALVDAGVLAAQLDDGQVAGLGHRLSARREARIHLLTARQ